MKLFCSKVYDVVFPLNHHMCVYDLYLMNDISSSEVQKSLLITKPPLVDFRGVYWILEVKSVCWVFDTYWIFGMGLDLSIYDRYRIDTDNILGISLIIFPNHLSYR